MEKSATNQIIESLKLDVDELNQFVNQCQRDTNKLFLLHQVQKLENQIKFETEQQRKKEASQQKATQEDQKTNQSSDDSLLYQKITDYAWDQEGKKVKIYLKLLEVGKVPSENITFHCTSTSIDLKIKGYQNRSLRFGVGKLFDQIETQESKHLVKNNAINLTLVKKENKHWDNLAFKEQTIKPPGGPKKGGEEEDPQAGLMNMMKDLYNSGDPEMKRTIAQAWQKQQDDKDGKGGNKFENKEGDFF